MKTQKEKIVQDLKNKHCRITKQRLILLDIILEGECASCKEIYYKAVKQDERIGLSTVYRMVNMLEEIGVISRNNIYTIFCNEEDKSNDTYTVEFDDGTTARLSAEKWSQVVRTGLRECGYMQDKELRSIKQDS